MFFEAPDQNHALTRSLPKETGWGELFSLTFTASLTAPIWHMNRTHTQPILYLALRSLADGFTAHLIGLRILCKRVPTVHLPPLNLPLGQPMMSLTPDLVGIVLKLLGSKLLGGAFLHRMCLPTFSHPFNDATNRVGGKLFIEDYPSLLLVAMYGG